MALIVNRAAAISAADRYSAAVPVPEGETVLRLAGTFVANVVLQVSDDDAATWNLVGVYERPGSWPFTVPHPGLQYRFGCRTGDYVSGTVNGAITQ